jgi:hypothetical protein
MADTMYTLAELDALRAQTIANMRATVADALARGATVPEALIHEALVHRHGGRRPGAGRPPLGDVKLVTVSVTLRPDQLERLDQLIHDTGGSRASIIRDALDAWMQPSA